MATITVKNGDKFTGVLSSATMDNADTAAYLLKMTKKSHDSQAQTNGITDSEEYMGHGEDHVMSFAVKDVAVLDVPGVSLGRPSINGTNGEHVNSRHSEALLTRHKGPPLDSRLILISLAI
jgi:hypothetical protein